MLLLALLACRDEDACHGLGAPVPGARELYGMVHDGSGPDHLTVLRSEADAEAVWDQHGLDWWVDHPSDLDFAAEQIVFLWGTTTPCRLGDGPHERLEGFYTRADGGPGLTARIVEPRCGGDTRCDDTMSILWIWRTPIAPMSECRDHGPCTSDTGG